MLVTVRRMLGQRLVHDPLELDRRVGPYRGQGRWIDLPDGVDDGLHGATEKRGPARGHLVDHHADGPDVRAMINRFLACLLRRHVAQRAHERGGDREVGDARVLDRSTRFMHGLGSCDQLGQAEVENLRHAVRGADEVGRLDVAVHDAALVGFGQAFHDLPGGIDDHGHRQWTSFDTFLDGFALVVGHDDEHSPVPGLIDGVDRADVRMIEAGRGACLLHEPFLRVRVAAERLG